MTLREMRTLVILCRAAGPEARAEALRLVPELSWFVEADEMRPVEIVRIDDGRPLEPSVIHVDEPIAFTGSPVPAPVVVKIRG